MCKSPPRTLLIYFIFLKRPSSPGQINIGSTDEDIYIFVVRIYRTLDQALHECCKTGGSQISPEVQFEPNGNGLGPLGIDLSALEQLRNKLPLVEPLELLQRCARTLPFASIPLFCLLFEGDLGSNFRTAKIRCYQVADEETSPRNFVLDAYICRQLKRSVDANGVFQRGRKGRALIKNKCLTKLTVYEIPYHLILDVLLFCLSHHARYIFLSFVRVQ